MLKSFNQFIKPVFEQSGVTLGLAELRTLSGEAAKLEGDSYSAWGEGRSPALPVAKKISTLTAKKKVQDLLGDGRSFSASIDSERSFQESDGSYLVFVKILATPVQ